MKKEGKVSCRCKMCKTVYTEYLESFKANCSCWKTHEDIPYCINKYTLALAKREVSVNKVQKVIEKHMDNNMAFDGYGVAQALKDKFVILRKEVGHD